MTTIIVAVVSTSTTILVLLLVGLLFGSKILKMLKTYIDSGNSSYKTMFSDHGLQQKEHNKLLEDTKTIKIDSKLILKITEKIDGKVETIHKFFLNEKEIKRLQLESLLDKQIEMKNSIDKLVGFVDEYDKITSENSKLLRENEELKEGNKELGRIIKLQKARISELEKVYQNVL